MGRKLPLIGATTLLFMGLAACDGNGANSTQQTQSPQTPAALPADVYARAEAFLPEHLAEAVKNERVVAHWTKQASRFWYAAEGADGAEYVLVDPDSGEKSPLFNKEKLIAALKKETGEDVTAADLKLDSLGYDDKTKQISFRFKDAQWIYADDDGLKADEKPSADEYSSTSPDGRWRVYAENYDLYIEDLKSGGVRRLTNDGSELSPYARPVVNPRTMVRQQTSNPKVAVDIAWSPDSRYFASYQMHLKGARQLSFVQSTPPNGAPPISYEYYYSLTGDTDVPTADTFVIDSATGKRVKLDLPAQEILYYYGPSFQWTKDSKEVIQFRPERGYHALQLFSSDAATGKTELLTENRSDTFVDFYGHNWAYLEDTDNYFWLSDEDGWAHGYLISRDGKRTKLTSGDWRTRYLTGTNPEENAYFIVGSGREEGQDPYLRHLYRVEPDSGQTTHLTPEPMDHDVSMSPDGRFFLDNMSLVNEPTKTVLRSATDGKIVMELGSADISALKSRHYQMPEPFKTVAADGETPIYGVIYRPSDFDPQKTYPIIENIYTGPHYVMAPKSFAAGLVSRNAASIAELGFVVVLVDGRGTWGRSREFLQFAYRNLHGVGLDDHITAIKALAERYPYMDASRVGIYGFSAGGYDVVRAMTEKPDFYKVGVSASGNHDNRLDKAVWNEQWMGLPLGPVYDENSNVTWAPKMKGALFLAHGELDENVPPAATRRLIDALMKANKDFDFLVVPNAHHFLDESPYFNRRRWDFFVRNLQHVEPPAGYEVGPLDK